MEDTESIGGEDEALNKDPRVFVPVSLRDDPLPHQGAEPLDQLAPKHIPPGAAGDGTSGAGSIHGLSSRCPQPQIPKGAGLKRPSLRGW